MLTSIPSICCRQINEDSTRHMEKFIIHSVLFSEIDKTFEYKLKRMAFAASFEWKSET
ncbi:hypothetical protein AMTRI_Chr04g186020 [Amborella trichopoda]